jgi:ligand-binding sensor domain-containing protein
MQAMNRLLQKRIALITITILVLVGGIFLGFNLKNTNFRESDYFFTLKGSDRGGAFKTANPKKVQELKIYDSWTHYTTKDGLPSNKINTVRVDGNRLWIGTDKGLALMEEGEITKVFKEKDGLAHHNAVSVDVHPMTGDVWIGTMRGLNRYSAGKFETFNQFNSGMPNDVIYQVFCIEKYVWMATGGGAGCYDTYTHQWKIFTEQNAPMHEPWTYGVSGGDGKVWIAAWGGGIIEYELETGQMRDYVDPDHEMEIDLFPDDGVVHDITTGSSYGDGILWVGTYFGMSRYDGARWKGYFDHDSGLASNFINFTKAQGSAVWVCTDNGVSNFNGETWVTYRPVPESSKGEVIITEGETQKTLLTNTTMSNNFVWGMDFDEMNDVIWMATAKGLSKGESTGKLMAKVTQ